MQNLGFEILTITKMQGGNQHQQWLINDKFVATCDNHGKSLVYQAKIQDYFAKNGVKTPKIYDYDADFILMDYAKGDLCAERNSDIIGDGKIIPWHEIARECAKIHEIGRDIALEYRKMSHIIDEIQEIYQNLSAKDEWQLGKILMKLTKQADIYHANCQIHGDFRLGNILYDGKDICVLDWGMTKFGNRLEDLAWLSALSCQYANRIMRDFFDKFLANYDKNLEYQANNWYEKTAICKWALLYWQWLVDNNYEYPQDFMNLMLYIKEKI